MWPQPVSTDPRRTSARVRLSGELDIVAAPRVDLLLRTAELGSEAVVLDLREVDFLDSAGARVLIAAERRIRRGGGRFSVVCGPGEVPWLLRLLRLETVLEVIETGAGEHH